VSVSHNGIHHIKNLESLCENSNLPNEILVLLSFENSLLTTPENIGELVSYLRYKEIWFELG